MRHLKGLLLVVATFGALSSGELGYVVKAETVEDILAVQIRSQGFACNKAQQATRDAKLSKRDYDVWVLKCDNATYRIGRYPDLPANVEKLEETRDNR